MGVGGLLMEIVSRPQPREPVAGTGGASPHHPCRRPARRRMGGPNKLMASFDGKPLVRRLAEQALGLESRAGDRCHRASGARQYRDGLDGPRPVRFVHNPDFADGLATSLKAGLAAVPAEADGALVLLGDMPELTPR